MKHKLRVEFTEFLLCAIVNWDQALICGTPEYFYAAKFLVEPDLLSRDNIFEYMDINAGNGWLFYIKGLNVQPQWVKLAEIIELEGY